MAKNITIKDQKERDIVTADDDHGLQRNLFVHAGAGAGKTTCIVGRVMNLLLRTDLQPQKLAVITYTRKATAELKNRMRFQLENLASHAESESLRERASQHLDKLSKAKISTVHSFCFDLLQEYPVEFGIDPSARILDDRGTAMVRREVMRSFYHALAIRDDRFGSAWSAYDQLRGDLGIEFSDQTMFTLFNLLYDNRELTPQSLAISPTGSRSLLQKAAEPLVERLIKCVCMRIHKEVKKPEDHLYASLEDVVKALQSYGINSKGKGDLTALIEGLLNGDESPFPNKGAQGNYSKGFLAEYKSDVKSLKEIVAECATTTLVQTYNLLLKIFPAYCALYDALKQDAYLLDFADCLISVRNGLANNSFLRKTLQQRFETLVVDEFQDSDPLQSEIMFHLAGTLIDPDVNWRDQKLAKGKVVFMGDPKQSIYGFARADIAIFLKVMELVVKQDKKSSIPLTTNFRSRPAIVAFVNRHFSQIITPDPIRPYAQPSYEAMVPHSSCDKDEVRVHTLNLSLNLESDVSGEGGINQSGKISADELRSRESWLVGQFLKTQFDSGVWQPGQVTILFRKSNAMMFYEEALEAHGVPVLNTKTSDFLRQPEVMSLISLVGLLVYPSNRHYVYGVLTSPFFGLTDSEIHGYFAKAGKSWSLHDLALQDSRIMPLTEILGSSAPLPERFMAACKGLGFFSAANAFKSEDLLATITKLKAIIESELELTHYNENAVVDNLYGGATATKRFGADPNEKELEEDKLLLATNMPSKVQLMTIHSAKGLENQIIILASPQDNTMEKVTSIIDRDQSTIIPLALKVHKSRMADLDQLTPLIAHEKALAAAEEKRVIYVAMTRAIEHLYLVRHDNGDIGSFQADFHGDTLGEEVGAVDLELDADYLTRHSKSSLTSHPAPASITVEEHNKQRKSAAKRLSSTTQSTLAVTQTLEAEAQELFRDHREARNRGREIGNLLHEMMEWICTRVNNKSITKTVVSEELTRKNQDYCLPESVVGELRQALHRFVDSDLYRTICDAHQVFTELPFRCHGKVQGVIDLLYVNDKGLHIIDWKSDVFDSPERAQAVTAFYQKQIHAYARALEDEFDQVVASSACVYLMQVS